MNRGWNGLSAVEDGVEPVVGRGEEDEEAHGQGDDESRCDLEIPREFNTPMGLQLQGGGCEASPPEPLGTSTAGIYIAHL